MSSWSQFDSVMPKWVKPTERSIELRIISEPCFWTFHFDVQIMRKRRCGGQACYLCAVGAKKQIAAVVMCVDTTGQDRLLELRARQREVFESYDTLIGLRVRVRKAGKNDNSPIEVKVLEYSAAHGRDISRLVETFGEPAILIGSEEVIRATSSV